MRKIIDLRPGDYVGMYHSQALGSQMLWAGTVKKITPTQVVIDSPRSNRYSRQTGLEVPYKTSCIYAITLEQYEDWQNEQIRRSNERTERDAAERAFSETEACRLAYRIHAIGAMGELSSKQLASMPIDRLRQIVAWLDELKK